jgi:PhnB protein
MAQRSLQAQLSVRDGRAAFDCHRKAFGAVERYRFGGTDDLEEAVVQLAAGDPVLWVEDESPPHGRYGPRSVGGATTRMLLIIDDPRIGDGAGRRGRCGGGPPGRRGARWRIGRLADPFGHRWEIGMPIGDWPPAG